MPAWVYPVMNRPAMWNECDMGRYTVVITASGLRPSLLGRGGRARNAVAASAAAALVGGDIPRLNVKAAADAKNFRRERRACRSCMGDIHRGGRIDSSELGGEPVLPLRCFFSFIADRRGKQGIDGAEDAMLFILTGGNKSPIA